MLWVVGPTSELWGRRRTTCMGDADVVKKWGGKKRGQVIKIADREETLENAH